MTVDALAAVIAERDQARQEQEATHRLLEEIRVSMKRALLDREEIPALRADLAAERDRADRAEALTDAKVERAAKAMFEAGGVVEGDWTWADVVRDEAGRAELWRNDARQVLTAALSAPEATA